MDFRYIHYCLIHNDQNDKIEIKVFANRHKVIVSIKKSFSEVLIGIEN